MPAAQASRLISPYKTRNDGRVTRALRLYRIPDCNGSHGNSPYHKSLIEVARDVTMVIVSIPSLGAEADRMVPTGSSGPRGIHDTYDTHAHPSMIEWRPRSMVQERPKSRKISNLR